jgi:transcriptional regulator with XRE-family HTH domain
MEPTFSDWLEEEMNTRSWSRAELARRSGISAPQITRLLNREQNPGRESIEAIANALHLPIETVYRAAGIIRTRPNEDEEWEVWKGLLRQLTQEERERYYRQMQTELEYQKQQEQLAVSRKRHKTGPLPNLG